jgi:hypothetical protein
MKTHMLTARGSPENAQVYRVWANMIQRCTNQKNARYKDYGARGIRVCARWHSALNFFEDMGLPPKGHTLDRIDNNKGYSPRNCRWTDARTQAQNSRRAVQVEIDGEVRCISEWCRATGITYGLYKARVKRGWEQHRALTEPPSMRGLRALGMGIPLRRGKKINIVSTQL